MLVDMIGRLVLSIRAVLMWIGRSQEIERGLVVGVFGGWGCCVCAVLAGAFGPQLFL